MTNAERKFIRDLETVSTSLAVWAQSRISKDGWTVEACKLHLLNAVKVCGRA